MNIFFILITIFILFCIVLIWCMCTYNRYQSLIIRINEVEVNIDSTLRKRFDLLNKSINIIKANQAIDGEVLEMIVKLRSRKLSNFELDRQLYEAINQFNFYLDTYQTLRENESLLKINISLSETEHEITAFRNYYNDNITKYNFLIKKLPTNLIGIILKYKEKTYFDGKNMNDTITNDFKL